MGSADEEILVALGPVLDAVAAGQTEGHGCPVCEGGNLAASLDDGFVQVRCGACGLSFEGWLA